MTDFDWGDALNALGNIGGQYVQYRTQSEAADRAANAMNQGYGAAAGTTQSMYQQSREDMAPWRTMGEASLNSLAGMVAAGPGEFKESPSYLQNKAEMEKTLMRKNAATGNRLSGAGYREGMRYAGDLASKEYDNFLNRYYQSLTPFQSMAGVGMTAAGQQGQNAMATGQSLSNLAVGSGSANANNAVNQGNVQSNMYSNIGNILSQYLAQQQAQNTTQPNSGTQWYDFY